MNYRFNDEYVCKKFLVDNGLYDEAIHTDIHRDSVEREVLVDALEVEKKEIEIFREEVLSLTANLNYDTKFLGRRLFISLMYLIFSIVSMIAVVFIGINDEVIINQYVNYGLLGVLSISVVLLIICVVKYSKKLAEADLVEDAIENSEHSIQAICKEEEMILNPRYKTYENSTLNNLSFYQKNRKSDLAKIKKIANKKETISSFWLITSAVLSLIPILEFGLVFVLKLFNIVPFELEVGIGLSLLSLIFALIHLILLIVFRKRRFAYYLIYLYMIVITILSILIKK